MRISPDTDVGLVGLTHHFILIRDIPGMLVDTGAAIHELFLVLLDQKMPHYSH